MKKTIYLLLYSGIVSGMERLYMMKYTVNQIAKKLDISRQTIYKYISLDPDIRKLFYKDIDSNIYTINNSNIIELIELLNNNGLKVVYETDKTVSDELQSERQGIENNNSFDPGKELLLENIINDLREQLNIKDDQLKIKDEQIKVKDQQIDKLLQINTNNQILLLQNKDIYQEQETNIYTDIDSDKEKDSSNNQEYSETENNKKKSLFQRIFGR